MPSCIDYSFSISTFGCLSVFGTVHIKKGIIVSHILSFCRCWSVYTLFLSQNFPFFFLSFQVLREGFTQPFVLLIDCVGYSPAFQLPLSHVSRILYLLPPGAQANLRSVISFLPSKKWKKWFKSLSSIFDRRLLRMVEYASSIRELHRYVTAEELALPEETCKSSLLFLELVLVFVLVFLLLLLLFRNFCSSCLKES